MLTLKIEEGVNITEPVGIVVLSDYNVVFEGVENFTFSITEGNEAGKFDIGNDTGEIQLVTALDYEETAEYMLVVHVASAADPIKTAVVAVAVCRHSLCMFVCVCMYVCMYVHYLCRFR